MAEPTGSISINEHDIRDGNCTGCNYDPVDEKGPLGLSRDTWVKLVIWFLPMVFFAGGIYFNYVSLSEKVVDNSEDIRGVWWANSKIEKIQIKQESNIEKIRESQNEVKQSIKEIDSKLDAHGNVLSALKVRFNLKTESQVD